LALEAIQDDTHDDELDAYFDQMEALTPGVLGSAVDSVIAAFALEKGWSEPGEPADADVAYPLFEMLAPLRWQARGLATPKADERLGGAVKRLRTTPLVELLENAFPAKGHIERWNAGVEDLAEMLFERFDYERMVGMAAPLRDARELARRCTRAVFTPAEGK
jgi:hypothetical protein